MCIKRSLLFFVLMVLATVPFFAAPLHFEPVRKQLPDGTEVQLYLSGDEFFNYLHDVNGFPLKQGDDGYYYYLSQKGDDFGSTGLRFGLTDPFQHPEISKVKTPSWVKAKRVSFYNQMDILEKEKPFRDETKAMGTFNNLVIYIRFKNEPEFTISRATYETRFNSVTENSLRYFFREVSYGKLDMVSYHMPDNTTPTNCYTDINERNYFRPYSASNLIGYKDDNELTTREHSLLARAVTWIGANYDLPEGVNFDIDHDGEFDNIAFIIRGSSDGWSDLLWPHRWALYTQNVKLENLSVYGYTLQLEDVSPKTLSHEMFHALGAPDLYHYDNDDVPVGPWDIMANGRCHPGAWMKHKYGGWIDNIPEISKSGTYSLKPLSSEEDNSYIIRSPYSTNQFFVVEYRKKTGIYESALPASGMIVTRIDSRYRGNAGGAPDEIFIFRRNGTPDLQGKINEAALPGAGVNNTFSDFSNPYAFLQEGTKTGIVITDITLMGDSMTFTVDLDYPTDLTLTPVEDFAVDIGWNSFNPSDYVVAVSESNEALKLNDGHEYSVGDIIGTSGKIIYYGSQKFFRHENLCSDEKYYYTIWTRTGNDQIHYSSPVMGECRAGVYTITQLPFFEGFDDMISELPRGWKSTNNNEGWAIAAGDSLNGLKTKSSFSEVNWLYTPGFNLLKGQKYQVSFSYRNDFYDTHETLVMKGGISRWDGGMNKFLLLSSVNFRYKDWALHKAVIQPVVSGSHYFGFYTGINGKGIVIDNFSIEKVPQETKNHSDPIEFYPNPASDIITVPAKVSTGISIFRSDGIMVFNTVIETMKELDLSSLNPGIYVIRFTTGKDTSTGRLILK